MRIGRLGRVLLATWVAVALAVGAVAPTVAQPAPPVPCNDLSITGISFDPAQPIQGQTATISIEIHNDGCASEAFVVQFRPGQFAPSGPSVTVPELAADSSTTLNLSFAFPNDGNFLTVVQIDTGNDIRETNEVNNLEIAPITVLAATTDLSITGITTNPAQPVSGRVTTISITVQHTGNTDAGPFRVQWKPSLFTPAYSTLVNSLAAGTSTVVTFDHTFPFQGTWNGWATVDSDRQVRETDESNNTLSQAIEVDPPLPDLIVSDAFISPANPVPGQIATMTITIQNIGHVEAGNFRVQWKPGPFVPALSRQVNSLAVGATTDVVFDYTYRFPGTFNGRVRVDPFFQVRELEEGNNTQDLAVTVSPNVIDLVITNTQIIPNPPTQGENTTVNITVTNQGNTPAGSFVVSWNPDTLGLIVPSQSTLTKQVFGLGAGQSTVVSFSYSYPEFGNFRTLAKVDAQNNILEGNETNNLDIVNLTVEPAPIDLVITSFTLDPASPARTGTTTATITVQNSGPFPAGPFAVQWRLNADNSFGPTEFLPGLNAGQSFTVTLEGVFFTAGPATTAAVVDPFNQVVEPGAGAEDNNIETLNVTVRPKSATLRVTFNHIDVIDAGDDGLDGNAEWDPILFAVLSPGQSCNAFGETIDDVECFTESDGAVEDGDTIDIGSSITVTLEELTPLAIAVAALEEDSPPDVANFEPEFLGVATQVAFPADYQGLGTFHISGAEANEGDCDDGHCFDVSITVEVLSTVP